MASSCDMCAHYVYDDEDDFYECLVNMDEDDFARFVARGYDNCPYFQLDSEASDVTIEEKREMCSSASPVFLANDQCDQFFSNDSASSVRYTYLSRS